MFWRWGRVGDADGKRLRPRILVKQRKKRFGSGNTRQPITRRA